MNMKIRRTGSVAATALAALAAAAYATFGTPLFADEAARAQAAVAAATWS
ncbi:MAG: hypothetical protein JNL30_05845 [Rubrivivax sp.]|nr:hypothetical protein [Rubrivivax sp.]